MHVPFAQDDDEDEDSDLYLAVDDGLIQEAVTSGGDSSLWGGTDEDEEECKQGLMSNSGVQKPSNAKGGTGSSDKCGQNAPGEASGKSASSTDPPDLPPSGEGG